MPDEAQNLNVAITIDPIATRSTSAWLDQVNAFVVPDHLDRHTGGTGNLPDIHLVTSSLDCLQRLDMSACFNRRPPASAGARGPHTDATGRHCDADRDKH